MKGLISFLFAVANLALVFTFPSSTPRWAAWLCGVSSGIFVCVAIEEWQK